MIHKECVVLCFVYSGHVMLFSANVDSSTKSLVGTGSSNRMHNHVMLKKNC